MNDVLTLALVLAAAPISAQTPARVAGAGPGFPGTAVGHAPKVEIPWNRFHDYPELLALFDRVEAAFPELVKHEVIGHSVENRELRVYTVNDARTGPANEKPAMWIDGNVHGNEVQGGEAALYTLWYVCENASSNDKVAELLKDAAFYVLPSQNPDGRSHWFERAHNAHSSRTGVMPTDDDDDGRFDEDPADDLDGDGQITQMRKFVPGQGTHRQDPDDPRILVPVPPNDEGRRGDWILVGEEGLDDDGDGRINEDDPGGYDMNRAWPSSWAPEHVQFGAGPYPLYWPEPRAIANFIQRHSNIAAVQSFHNAGGMILRGPGTESFGEYPSEDLRAYDELGRDGEKMLPFYKYMVIWKDLYTVWGGFVNWTYEGLGIVSFTNELWNDDQYFQDAGRAEEAGKGAVLGGGFDRQRHWFDDKLLMGAGFVAWHAFEHPLFGKVEIGGYRKDVGRVPPTFMIEEMVHRNAMFCLGHARAMPKVVFEDVQVTELGEGVKAVDLVVRNLHAIPTRTGMAARGKVGAPDVIAIEGAGLTVIAGGVRSDRFRPERIELQERHPERLLRERGVGSRGEVRVRWLVRGKAEKAVVTYGGEKVRGVRVEVRL
ncbi:MAG: peptidase M14 [Planctomycetes bacterium]|nr:peptidase M14 [Planctomycetota bacterium]